MCQLNKYKFLLTIGGVHNTSQVKMQRKHLLYLKILKQTAQVMVILKKSSPNRLSVNCRPTVDYDLDFACFDCSVSKWHLFSQ